MLTTRFAPSYVLLCFFLAFAGCYLVTCLCEQLRLAYLHGQEGKPKAQMLQILTAVCLGGIGKWSMHVIGMASLELHDANGDVIHVQYNLGVSVMSLIVVLVTSTISIMIATKDVMFAKTKEEIVDMFVESAANMSMAEAKNITAKQIIILITTRSLGHLLLGGMVAGSGVAVMHYVGVAAMEFQGEIRWLPGVVATSVLIACVACMAAFWILFRLLSIFPNYESLRLASAFIMSIAVCGVHYIGMMGSTFEAGTKSTAQEMGSAVMNSSDSLIGPLIAAVAVLWLVNLYVLVDLRSVVAKLGYSKGSKSPPATRSSFSSPKVSSNSKATVGYKSNHVSPMPFTSAATGAEQQC